MGNPQLTSIWRRRRSDVLAVVVFLLFFVACFGQFIWHKQFVIGGDAFFYTHPLRTMAWQMIRAGTLPLWTPGVMSGFPLLAMSTVALFYPLTWGYLFLPSYWAEEIFILAPFILAPLFTYSYARQIELSYSGALLAALSFTYGGLMTNTYGMNGSPTNALIWLPLLLLVIERSRRSGLGPSLIGAALIYAVSIATGHGHSFLQVCGVALGYALFISLVPAEQTARDNSIDSVKPSRWRPLLVAAGGIALACGLNAFQILEILRAARRSIRGTLTYEFFSSGGFTPAEVIRSIAAPLYHYIEVTTYQAPLVVVLAIMAVVFARKRKDPRVYFWLLVAVVALLLLLGGNTPLYRVLYHIPVFNMFRRPSRYAFEFTFAVSMLGAYGWDAIAARRNLSRADNGSRQQTVVGIALLVLTAILAFLWTRSVVFSSSTELVYLLWKACFTIVSALALAYGLLVVTSAQLSRAILMSVLLLICFVEPFILISKWWPGTGKPGARLVTPGLTTKWLQQFPAAEQRAYIRVNGPDEETAQQPRFDSHDRTAIFGIQNVAGYEPLFPNRYSRALGDVEFDAINPRPGVPPALALFSTQSHVLDILNARYVVVWPDLTVTPGDDLMERDGVRFTVSNLGLTVAPGAVITLPAPTNTSDTLALVTSLANSVDVKQGSEVAQLRLFTADGRLVKVNLRAGNDSSEWAHERSDVRPIIQHQLANVFETVPGDAAGTFPALRYIARLSLGAAATSVTRIEVQNTTPATTIALWKATLYNTTTNASAPFKNALNVNTLDPSRWQVAKDADGVLILRNLRVLPRVWLVSKAEAVTEDEALRRIRGEGSTSFDPEDIALLEVGKQQLPPMPTGMVDKKSSVARIVNYEPNHLVIDTDAAQSTVLVVSEMFYPGWQATLDQQPTSILLTDYLLRGIAVPAGRHRVEMRYTAPAVRNGAIISISTLFMLLALGLYSRRSRNHL